MLSTLNRGTFTEVGNYLSQIFFSEISGNVIDLCPVGALTSKPYSFKARPWELRLNECVDVTDSLGANIYVNVKESEICRILPKNTKIINESIISDKARFSYDANKNNRIRNLFQYDGYVGEISNWAEFYYYMDSPSFRTDPRKTVFFIDGELDLITLNLLRKISYFTYMKIRILNPIDSKDNFYVSGLKSNACFENKNNLCFLLSSNIHLENSILNAKLRLKKKQKMINIFSTGQSFSTDIPVTFVSLNSKSILNLFTAKGKLSKFLCSSYQSFFILGESIKNCGINISSLMSFIKLFFTNSQLIYLNKFCNSESLNLLNLKNFTKKDLIDLKSAFFLDLDDKLSVRKVLQMSQRNFWLNSHGSGAALKSSIIIPTLTVFEEDKILLNLEQRPQKTKKIFKNFYVPTISVVKPSFDKLNSLQNREIRAQSIKRILKYLFFSCSKESPRIRGTMDESGNSAFRARCWWHNWEDAIKCYSDTKTPGAGFSLTPKSNFLNYLSEIIFYPEKFELFRTTYFSSESYFQYVRFTKNVIKKYPLKSSIEDFYCSTKFTKNSFVMNQCSQYKRVSETNFSKRYHKSYVK